MPVMPAMPVELVALSLRYSSWSIRPWLALTHAGIPFKLRTVDLQSLSRQTRTGDSLEAHIDNLAHRRETGSVTGLYPVLLVDGVPIHESLAICEWAADQRPDALLWPTNTLDRARARAVSCEMATGFGRIRGELFCHVFGRVPGYRVSSAAAGDIRRVFELWEECLQRSGGPYLFGRFTIADCMYFPMLTRFITYEVDLPSTATAYSKTLLDTLAVQRLLDVARDGPAMPAYDEYLKSLGGDPGAALRR